MSWECMIFEAGGSSPSGRANKIKGLAEVC